MDEVEKYYKRREDEQKKKEHGRDDLEEGLNSREKMGSFGYGRRETVDQVEQKGTV